VEKKFYQLIEHTADIGIRIEAADLKGLFEKAAIAMFDIMAQRLENPGRKITTLKVTQSALDLEGLLVNWLNELLSLSATRGLIFTGFRIDDLNEKRIEAESEGEDIRGFKVSVEIKAATYHQLKITKTSFGWLAEVIFDV